MIKLNVHHNWRLHKCVGMNVSAYNNLREWQKREFGYTCQIITHEVTRRKWSRDGSCRVTHVRSGMHKMTYIYLSINIKIRYHTFINMILILFQTYDLSKSIGSLMSQYNTFISINYQGKELVKLYCMGFWFVNILYLFILK